MGVKIGATPAFSLITSFPVPISSLEMGEVPLAAAVPFASASPFDVAEPSSLESRLVPFDSEPLFKTVVSSTTE